MTPEQQARQQIDAMLTASGWAVQTKDNINLSAQRGVAICELSFKTGEPDHTHFVDGKAIGTVEAKPVGVTLTSVEEQSAKYVAGVQFGLPAWKSPLAFCYESTGQETFGFFQQNLVMDLSSSEKTSAEGEARRVSAGSANPYNHEKAVADGVNVGCDIYRIKPQITEAGSKVEAGLWADKRDRQTRKVRWEQLDEVLAYDASNLDRDVVATDQIRTVLETFRDKVFTEMFPGRTDLPKTLIFAKDDTHADDIVRLCREVFGKGNDF